MKKIKRLLSLFLVMAMVFTSVPLDTFAETGTNPGTGTTEGQPFATGTAGSEKFRIPAMVTLDSGRIVAAADARWGTFRDGGGLDTIVSYSDDKGAKWNYSLPNYFGDNGNVHNTASTAFIDPILTTDGTNVYMMVDLFPAGYALNGAAAQPSADAKKGFNDAGYLRLSGDDRATYTYYLKKNEDTSLDSYYVIMDSSDSVVSGYTVDAYFNIEGTTDDTASVDTNLFWADSPFEVYPTDYLYLTKSTDGGETFGEPTLVNVKADGEQTYLVGPGRGLITSDNTIIIPCYVYDSGYERTSFIYSTDGVKWTRSTNATSSTNEDIRSSEAQVVELADGTLRFFFRNSLSQVCYVDTTGNAADGYTWSNKIVRTGVYSCSNTQMSAIKYSKQIEGREAIIISYPASTSASGDSSWDRYNGRITIGLVQDDGTMDWKYTYKVNDNGEYFWYSCLTELNDGSISLLFENGESGAAIEYANYTLAELAPGADVSTFRVEDADGNTVDALTIKPGNVVTLTVAGSTDGTLSVSSSDENIVVGSLSDTTLILTAGTPSADPAMATITVTDGTSTFTIPIRVSGSEYDENLVLIEGESRTYENVNTTGSELTGLDTQIATGTLNATVKKYQAELGADSSFGGEKINLTECAYAFDLQSDGTYIISHTDEDGTVTYLHWKTNSSGSMAGSADSASITLNKDSNHSTGMFSLYDETSSNNGGYLYFHKDTVKFNRNSGYVADNCNFYIYEQKDSVSEDDVIPGYVQITDAANIESGKQQYLIVAQGTVDTAAPYYVVHPSTSTDVYSHVAHVLADEVVNTKYDLTFTGVSAGETEVIVGDTTYRIKVTDEVDVTLEMFEAYYAEGSLDTNVDYDEGIVNVENVGSYDSPTLVNFDNLKVGESREVAMVFVNGNSKYAITSGQATVNSTSCRALAGINANSSLDEYEWIITKVSDGYTIRTKGGQYLSANGTAVIMDDEPLVFQFTYADDGTAQVSYTSDGTKYFNNFAGTNTGIGGWSSDAISVQFWLTETAIVGKGLGTTDVVIGNTTYHITVEQREIDVYMTVGDTETVEGITLSNTNEAAATAVTGGGFPYTAITEIVSGEKYLIGNASAIIKNQTATSYETSDGTWSQDGLVMQASVDFAATSYWEHMWTFTLVEGTTNQYYVQNKNGLYMNIASDQNITLFDAAANPNSTIPTVTVTASGSGYTLNGTGTNMYANNYGGDRNQYVAGWTGGTVWTLYKGTGETTTITAVAPGKTDITTADTVYHVTVLNTPATYKDVYVETGKSVEVTDSTGNYADQVVVHDKELVNVTATGSDAATTITFTGAEEGRAEVQVGTTLYYVYVTQNIEEEIETEDVVLYVGQTAELSSEVNGIIPEVKGEGFDTYLKNYVINGLDADTLAVRSDETQTIDGISYYYVGEEVALSDCLYTFALNEDGTYKVSAATSDGTTVYLDHQDAGSGYANTQDTDSDANITIADAGSEKFGFAVASGNTDKPYRFLYFHGSNGDKTHKLDGGNMASLTATSLADGYKFEIYRPMADGDTSSAAIPGYVKVTSLDGIVDGGKYLIVSSHTCNETTCYYAVYPTLQDNTNYHSAQIVRITGHAMDNKYHEITFTGAAAGTTTLKVDNKTYNITVKNLPTNATIDSTPFISNQSGASNGYPITRLTMTADNTFDLGVGNGYLGENISWSIINEDGTEATWATISEDGVITPADQTDATSIYDGYVVATIDGTSYKIPLKINPAPTMVDGATANRLYDVYLSEMYHTTVYYGWIYEYRVDGTSNYGYTQVLREAIEGEVIYNSINSNRYNALDFFADPAEGYALTHMGSTNSSSHYMKISGTDPAQTEFITTSGVAGKQQHDINAASVEGLVKLALDLGCDGAQGFTRYERDGVGGVSTVLDYRSEQLPTVSKELNGVLGSSGLKEDWQVAEEGKTLTAEVGDYVYFTVKVTTYDAEDEIEYTDVRLTDLLEGAAFYTKDQSDLTKPINGNNRVIDITETINSGGLDGTTYEYYVVYQITRDDVLSLDYSLVNEVQLQYNYSSEYSNAVYDGVGADTAEIMITTTLAENLVVDFGLPVTYVFESAKGLVEVENADTTYKTGTVTVTSELNLETNKYTNTVVYTPTKVIENGDWITLQEVASDQYTAETLYVGIYPATTVYYEEGFMSFTGDWGADISKGDGSQAARLLSTKFEATDKYGYDGKYVAEETGASNGTEAISNTAGNTATFDFTGTGTDIYANCTPDSGNATIVVRDKQDNAIKKLMIVNTKMAAGVEGSAATSGQAVNAYSVPISSVSGLDHGNYTVKIQHSTTQVTNAEGEKEAVVKPLKLDGFRVYNTMEDSSVFEVHNEDDPNFVEMRNVVLNTLTLDSVLDTDNADNVYADDIAAGLTQVLDKNETAGAVILTPPSSNLYTNEHVKDLLENGPKNEIFLFEGQTLTFTLEAGFENIQIGMRAVNDAVGVQLTNGGSPAVATLTSSTDMFFGLGDVGEVDKTIVITNVDDGDASTNRILSITDLKYFAPETTETTSVFSNLTRESLTTTLVGMGYPENPDTNEPTDVSVTEVFTDVEADAWYVDAVQYVYDADIMTGNGELFSPGNPMTRAQIVTTLYRLAGSPEVTDNSACDKFTDVEAGTWYANAVCWAYNIGVTTGNSDTTFGVNIPVTREQVATFLYRYANKEALDTTATGDLSAMLNADQVKEYAMDAVTWAVGAELISGSQVTNADGSVSYDLAPQATATRAQLAAILMRFCEAYNL